MSFRFSAVEPLAPMHNVVGFDCGSAAQSEWLTEHALQAHRAGLSRVYVVRGIEDGLDRVVGYYALAAGSVAPASATRRMMHGAGRYHQPIVLLTRLGVDRAVQGVGLGRALVVDALRRIAGAAEVIGVRAALIHCESTSARDFYLRLAAFEPSPTDPMHLLLLIKDLRRALNPNAELLAVASDAGRDDRQDTA
ncbi:N-acetyltransferase GCN5 [Asanoa ishikariensis]|uniref:Acetyltransferase (GNAT) family protein n=1 Tax=Asanoa ishikariensis TaxID=137265 RepID=A0A1H3LGU3_9ACTN|nr:N-acetyltransferase [Asanoa ishikariensis]GIF65476.1 N-acetyltransferase GCN5 [Asanoa ishikariensis]SDY63633.1 Acetyltransferase (GNAT) family protein [Asanoa ishikariensis]